MFLGWAFLLIGFYKRAAEKKRKLIVGLSPIFQRIGLKNFLDGI
jgi:hypothetical protein